uniref:Gag protein n=1 Tax=Mesocestoides corti TaxID=53468 RepID=A0A5K3G093_MESCO
TQLDHFKYSDNKHVNQLAAASIQIDDFIQTKLEVTSRSPTTASFAYYTVHGNVMGQAASIRRDRTPLTNVCKSGFTGIPKRSLFANSKRRSKNEESGVPLKQTVPRKLTRVKKSIHTPICQECLYDDEEIIREVGSSDDSGTLHEE